MVNSHRQKFPISCVLEIYFSEKTVVPSEMIDNDEVPVF